MNDNLKIKFVLDDGEISVVTTHNENLLEIFGIKMMNRVKSKRSPRQ